MIPETAILACLFVPTIGALFIWLTGARPNLRETVTLVTASTLFCFVLVAVWPVASGGRPEVTLIEMFPGLSLAFKIEPLGATFGMIASSLWILTSIYAIGYMRGHHEKNQTRFFAFFALSIASTMGIAFAGNMLTLFTFYEVLSVCTYPLVTHSGTAEAKRAGRTYLGILLGTSIGFQLFAIGYTWIVAGTLDFTEGGILDGKISAGMAAFLMALFVFGIGKAAIMPFHRWLPAAMVAPTPVSALLHAVAVVKAGVFSVLKVAIYIFGIDFLAATGAGYWIAYLAGATIIIASLVAMTKDNLKARLAYSTVSQLSYVILGAMLATSASTIGGAMHIAMHAFGKITLFFCAGAIMVATHKTNISQMHGLGRKMPFTFIAFGIASLSIIGLPPLGGAWSKWQLALGAAETGQALLIAALMISSVLNVVYLIPIAIRAFMPAPAELAEASQPDDRSNWRIEEAPALCVVPLCITAFGCFVLFFLADLLFRFLNPIVPG
jgi:multicomponent Na+:H+ antiporter subunit D